MKPQYRIELFGGLCVWRGEQMITPFQRQKSGALLAYLAYHFPYTHPRDMLIEHLWPGCALDAGRNRLRVELSRLRDELETDTAPPAVFATRANVGIHPGSVQTDLAEFDQLLKQAESATSAGERIKLLQNAVELYRGPLLAGFYEGWVTAAQQRIEKRYFQALQQLIHDLERAGKLGPALDYAAQGLGVDPLHEPMHGEVMRLYAATARPAEALRHYADLTRKLSELGERPSAAVREVARQIEAQSIQPKTTAEVPADGKYRILIVEDDVGLANILRLWLTAQHYECHWTSDGNNALTLFESTRPHLVLLDLMLPGLGGREICKRIRARSTTPIIMMTQLGADDDQVQGFQLGADEYVTKPFAAEVLSARVQALLRRTYDYSG